MDSSRVDYCDGFISCLGLAPIHCRGSIDEQVMLHFSKSVSIKKNVFIYIFYDLRVSTFSLLSELSLNHIWASNSNDANTNSITLNSTKAQNKTSLILTHDISLPAQEQTEKSKQNVSRLFHLLRYRDESKIQVMDALLRVIVFELINSQLLSVSQQSAVFRPSTTASLSFRVCDGMILGRLGWILSRF